MDVDNYLIVVHEVTHVDSDRRHLIRMAQQAKTEFQTDSPTAFADEGYYNGDEYLCPAGRRLIYRFTRRKKVKRYGAIEVRRACSVFSIHNAPPVNKDG